MDREKKALQIFEYLRAVNSLSETTIRHVKQYEKIWWQRDIPNCDGCYMKGERDNPDIWLEVHKQEIPEAPVPPSVLKKWLVSWSDPDQEPQVKKRIAIELSKKIQTEVKEEGEENVELIEYETFEDNSQRIQSLEEWLNNFWRPWAVEVSSKNKIQKLYTEFFSLLQELQREGDELELIWGHGLLTWHTEGETITRPMIVTPVELQFDAHKGIFTILPTSKGTSMESDMLNGISIPYPTRLQEIERQVESTELDVWDEEVIISLLKEIVNTISPDGEYVKGEIEIKDTKTIPKITYSPLIFLRKKGGRAWDNELRNIINEIKLGYPVPNTIKALTDENFRDDLRDAADSGLNLGDWKSVGEELLFPLATNNEQKMIAERLSKGSGVIVQGPPGTGKSHTIANLICHLLAHGKRVLVTSEKERALRVLKDKIPIEVRDLCVSVLGGDSASIRDLENSIKNIAENLDAFDPELLEKEVTRLRNELYETRKNKTRYHNSIKLAGEIENKKILIDRVEMTPLEAAHWVSQNMKHDWLPDALNMDMECPLSHKDLNNFFELVNALKGEDIDSLEKKRPMTSYLETPTEFQQKVEQIRMLREQVKKKEACISDWKYDGSIEENLEVYKEEVTKAYQDLCKLEDRWITIVLKDALTSEERRQIWGDLAQECSLTLQKIRQLDKELLEHEISLPATINQVLLEEDLIALKNRLKENKGIGWLFKNVFGRKYAYLLESISVNGIPIRNEEDIEILIRYIERSKQKSKMTLKWNRIMEEIEGPQLDAMAPRFAFQVEDYVNQINLALEWEEKKKEAAKDVVKRLGIPKPSDWMDKQWFEKTIEGFEVLEIKKRYQEIQIFFSKMKAELIRGKEASGSHVLWEHLLEALDSENTKIWKDYYMEVVRLEDLEDRYHSYVDLKERLSGVAPKWAGKIAAQGRNGEIASLPDDWEIAWKWSRINTYLDEIREKTNLEEMEKKFQVEAKTEAQIMKELVAKSTWLAQIRRTTSSQKRSLHAWMKAIQRIGKGTGKYASMYRNEAKKEMKTAKDAIPVWIMPINRIIENIQLTKDLFDVIIVDESSQSNMMSLCALLRAKKAVIVGDDNQISPESIGTNIGDIHELITRYLEGIPQASRFEIKTSLYEIASQVFESKVVLREHFRCVPEIIQFSNDLMYEGRMLPLRQPLSAELLEPPVAAIFVREGFRDQDTRKTINRPEAEAIVGRIVEFCEDPTYEGKTMGVISLQGQDQANLIEEMLRESIGEEEMINRKLICGDSYFFQGDERDVMFLSLVAAPNMRIGVLSKRSDYQRFNVAASRARDQMFLYHSARLEDLNPECVRYRLLQYCQNPHRLQDEFEQVKDMFDSKFEEDVYKIISAKGYRVTPQVKIGTLGKRIDMVIEGVRSRLAIECDGDRWHGLDKWEEDIERQRMLERVGWIFWRIRGSAFYRDPRKAMESLWSKLDEMGIKPL